MITCPECDTTAFLEQPIFCSNCGQMLADAPKHAIHEAAIWRRTASLSIDVLALAVPSGLVAWKIFRWWASITRTTFSDAPREIHDQWFAAGLFVFLLQAMLVFWLAYGTVCEGLFGKTLGKLVLGLRVVRNEKEGGRITWRQAIGRQLARCLTASSMGGGYFYAFIDRQKRMFHDIMSRTIVVED